MFVNWIEIANSSLNNSVLYLEDFYYEYLHSIENVSTGDFCF